METTVIPGFANGVVNAIPSKSVSQRALAAALLRQSDTFLKGIGNSEDEVTALRLIRQLGAEIVFEKSGWMKISSEFPIQKKENIELNCGESGLALRLFTPLAALGSYEACVSGEGSLLTRPLLFPKDLFENLNVQYSTKGDQLPIKVKGPLKPANIQLDGSKSSQLLSGLLFTFAAAKAEGVCIRVNNLNSRPYIDLTLSTLEKFGLLIPENQNYEKFYFPKVVKERKPNIPLEYRIEGDWSNAAFLLVAGAISGDITVKGLNIDSQQADRKILEALKDCGCFVTIQQDAIRVQSSVLNSFYFDATQCPDLFPPLAVLAANCTGMSVIKGISRLEYKESNRAETLQSELRKLGLPIRIEKDEMIIEGATLWGGEVDSHKDHRIAMACTVAALKAKEKVEIQNAEAVNKSYPSFFDDLQKLGINVIQDESL